MVKISVCVCTFKRTLGIDKLLQGLTTQKDKNVNYEIIIVDNDKNKSANSTVTKYKDKHKDINIIYDVETVQNIALARNKSVNLSSGYYIAFIDDDEIPEDTWLKELYASIKKNNADAVFGPVLPVYPPNTPNWIKKGNFFNRPEYPEGQIQKAGRAGNALVKSEWVKKYTNPFDPDYGLTGGEDSNFFSRIIKDGAKLCWAANAKVYEEVEKGRVNARWLLLRALRGGQGYADRKLEGKGFIYKTIHFLYRLLLSFFSQIIALFVFPAGYHFFIWWERKAFSNFGQFSVLFKYRYKAYKDIR